MRKITPRIQTLEDIKDALGKITYTNHSPTMKARLISYDKDKSYFIVIPHEKHIKYNNCEGQSFYLPTHMVICMDFIEERTLKT